MALRIKASSAISPRRLLGSLASGSSGRGVCAIRSSEFSKVLPQNATRPQKCKSAAIGRAFALAYKYRIAGSQRNCAIFLKVYLVNGISGLGGIGQGRGLDKKLVLLASNIDWTAYLVLRYR